MSHNSDRTITMLIYQAVKILIIIKNKFEITYLLYYILIF